MSNDSYVWDNKRIAEAISDVAFERDDDPDCSYMICTADANDVATRIRNDLERRIAELEAARTPAPPGGVPEGVDAMSKMESVIIPNVQDDGLYVQLPPALGFIVSDNMTREEWIKIWDMFGHIDCRWRIRMERRDATPAQPQPVAPEPMNAPQPQPEPPHA